MLNYIKIIWNYVKLCTQVKVHFKNNDELNWLTINALIKVAERKLKKSFLVASELQNNGQDPDPITCCHNLTALANEEKQAVKKGYIFIHKTLK